MQNLPTQPSSSRYTLHDFLPLGILFTLITTLTVTHQIYYGWHMYDAMRIAMASFFLIFGFFKVINLRKFAKAYAEYDLLAKHSNWYGYLYPFLEIGLGIAYLTSWRPQFTNFATLLLMLISAAGVFIELKKGKQLVCACLGVVFKVPMTYVTLAEDLIMAFMALLMLFM